MPSPSFTAQFAAAAKGRRTRRRRRPRFVLVSIRRRRRTNRQSPRTAAAVRSRLSRPGVAAGRKGVAVASRAALVVLRCGPGAVVVFKSLMALPASAGAGGRASCPRARPCGLATRSSIVCRCVVVRSGLPAADVAAADLVACSTVSACLQIARAWLAIFAAVVRAHCSA